MTYITVSHIICDYPGCAEVVTHGANGTRYKAETRAARQGWIIGECERHRHLCPKHSPTDQQA